MKHATSIVFLLLFAPLAFSQADEPVPPEGFRAIFNGKDLTGWHGLNPHQAVKLSGEKREANLKQQREEFAKHWRVENGELVNDGHGPYANTDEEFGDIEFLIQYKTVPKADSGIYLRGTPQVQIWDWHQVFNPKNPTRRPHLGSGGLFNNTPDTPGRDPLVLADKPFGEWNQFRIRQIGSRTWVWLNDKLVVDGRIMENYWDRSKPSARQGPDHVADAWRRDPLAQPVCTRHRAHGRQGPHRKRCGLSRTGPGRKSGPLFAAHVRARQEVSRHRHHSRWRLDRRR